ncbi:MAG: hypothetical protein M1826_003382 [Phylliscum demangeonii]|nr:MAG: hypothetical protein M1826_003382 [Phylliscum demangeonii]
MRLSAAVLFLVLAGMRKVFAHPGHDLLASTGHVGPGRSRSHAIELRPSRVRDRYAGDLRRRDGPSSGAAPAGASATAAPSRNDSTTTAWEAQTSAACVKAVTALNGQTQSASGIVVCHNIPSLDNSTGAFHGDLRLFRAAAPQGAWAAVADADISIGVSFVGASIVGSADDTASRNGSPSKATTPAAALPQMLQSLRYVAQLDAKYESMPMNLTQLVLLFVPNVTLSAVQPANQNTMSTSLTATEASFVTGVFAGSAVGAASALVGRPTPFVLPGSRLGIFPVGLIVTSAWAVLGVAVMAWGTIGRYQYREQYRRRKLREKGTGLKF